MKYEEGEWCSRGVREGYGMALAKDAWVAEVWEQIGSRESLLFVIPAFGGVVSWEGEGAPFKEADQSITYQIVDRPTQGHIFLSREYVQPQWVFDCVNARIILPTDAYMVGRVPPPHLSPFIDNEAEGYVPEYAEMIKRLQAAARKEVLPIPGAGKEDLDDPQNLLVEGIISRTEANEVAERKQKMLALENQYHNELQLELQGVQYSSSVSNMNKQSSVEDAEAWEESLPNMQQIAEDTTTMSKVVMSRKKRRLYEAMQIGKERKRAHVNLLKERKQKIEAAQGSEKS
ncbi:Pescadillo-like [Vitis vinifera]|uniref:Pescadillo-like n=1 Tax=Vitis vinifera TaxID=29760 RepID=A0A438JJ02_VITVI|nr:Pescadillo-like [Vitis vinifera]